MINVWRLEWVVRQLGTVDLEILDLAVKNSGTFDEKDLEGSRLSNLGVGRILDALASLKDREMLYLNPDGSFTITDAARGILWSGDIPSWARILRLLQIRSSDMNHVASVLDIPAKEAASVLGELRKGRLVLMSPQRIDGTVTRVFEILPEGAEALDRAEAGGFKTMPSTGPGTEAPDIIDDIVARIQESSLGDSEKEPLLESVRRLRDRLGI